MSISHSSVFLFLQHIMKEDGPGSDDCTVLQRAPMTSITHRSILGKLCASVCVWPFNMTWVLVQYTFLQKTYQENPLCVCVCVVCHLFANSAPVFGSSERQVCRYPVPDGCHTSVNPRKTNSPTSMSPAGHSSNKPLARELTTGQRPPRVSLDDGQGRKNQSGF